MVFCSAFKGGIFALALPDGFCYARRMLGELVRAFDEELTDGRKELQQTLSSAWNMVTFGGRAVPKSERTSAPAPFL